MNTEIKDRIKHLRIDVADNLPEEKMFEEVAKKIGIEDYVFDNNHNQMLVMQLRKMDYDYQYEYDSSNDVNNNEVQVDSKEGSEINVVSSDSSTKKTDDEQVDAATETNDEDVVESEDEGNDDTSDEEYTDNGYGATGGFFKGLGSPLKNSHNNDMNAVKEEQDKKDNENDSDKKDSLDKDEKNDEKSRDKDSEKSDGQKKKEEKDETQNNVASASTAPMMNGAGYAKDSVATDKRDEINRKSFNHGNRVSEGKTIEDGTTKPKMVPSNDSDNKTDSTNISSKKSKGKLKGKAKNVLDKSAKAKNFFDNPFRMAKNKISSFLLKFLLKNPIVLVVLGYIIIFIFILFMVLMFFADKEGMLKSSGTSSTHCSYSLKGVTSSGVTTLDGIQVELINCDGTQSNYTVLETIDFEKYVLGVALAEIGPDAPDESLKAQIIAVRSYSLTRNGGMCPGNKDNCFYGYNVTTNKIRMRACEADQVYWDYEKDIYRQDRGSISLYSPEINSGTIWKYALSEERKAEVLAIAEDVKGKVLLDSSGNVLSTSYNSTTSDSFLAGADKGYENILKDVYGSDNISSAECTTTGNIDYGDYVLSSDGHEILHQDLSSFLQSKGTSLDEFNSLIAQNVEKAGSGTRAGVVAAAVTLIAELGNNYNVKVPYFWGGGHESAINDYAKANWGSSSCYTYANSQSYNYCGLDCSGFVPWAIRNGGFNMSWARLAGDFQNISGAKRVSLSNSAVLQPGDLLESSGHIVLVVGVDEGSSQYICAEAAGNKDGVLFTRRAFNSSGYWGVNMDGYYNNSSNVRSN